MIRAQLRGVELLIARLRADAERAQNPAPVLLSIGVGVRDDAVLRLKSGGPDRDGTMWKPRLRDGGKAGVDRGEMRQSITVDTPSASTVRIGTNLAKARYFQIGTGIYGPWGTPIVPTTKKALSFRMGGARYTVRQVAGQPPREFLFFSDARRRAIARRFGRYIVRGVDGLEETG